ncbi:MAG TPA: adenylate kinase [Actinomycetes bacterium]|nr:adenylate kinase [Actinomycetes bacterium]
MRMVLMGPPGAGKGTQGKRLAEEFGGAHIATGDLFRSNAERQTELGRIAQEYMERGELVPDEIVIAMVTERLSEPDAAADFVLDGFPRTVPQAETLDRRLAELGLPLQAALNFEITKDELLRRLAARAKEEDRAEDEDEDAIQRRLESFINDTRPVVDYYDQRGLLLHVDAMGQVDEVTKRILDDLAARGLVAR